MLDVFDKLSKKARGWESRSGVEWAWVSLTLIDVPDSYHCYTGVVLIDGRQLGDLIGKQRRDFRLEPGEHRIVIHLGKAARVAGYPGKGIVSRRITLGPGERIDLACGADDQAAEPWEDFWRRSRRYNLTSISLAGLVGGLGWILYPNHWQSIVTALNEMGLSQVGAKIIASPMRFRTIMTIGLTLGSHLLGGLLFSVWASMTTRRLQAQFGYPYFFGRARTEESTEQEWTEF